jgi:hypothetical protein
MDPMPANVPSSSSLLPGPLLSELQSAGYFPETAARCLARAVRRAPVIAHLVRPETTFDGSEVRRHMTVLVLTPRHLVVTHLDDDPADALNPSQVFATSERVRLDQVRTTGISQVFDTDSDAVARVGATESEVTLGISWGGNLRLEAARALCDDPNCQAEHGWTGNLAPGDLALRVSARAEGSEAVAATIGFHEQLLDALDDLGL